MNTLSDLRSTLDEHADRVADGEGVARAAAVRHRVSVLRRRRQAAGAGALCVALVAVGAVTLAHRGSHAEPSAPWVLGVHAPTTVESLGYTYRTDGSSDVVSGHGTMHVDASSAPLLVSWTTDRPATVRLRLPDGEYWTSTRSDFRDYVVIPPGSGGDLEVWTTSGRVGLASYDVTAAQPAGVTRDGITYRREVAGTRLRGAVIGATGQPKVSTTFLGTDGQVRIAVLCTGAPEDAVLHVAVAGGGENGGGCGDTAFDPGSDVIGTNSGGTPGQPVRVRVWVTGPPTADGTSVRPLTPAEADAVRVGVGVYGSDAQRVAGGPMDRTIEYGGHTWRLHDVQRSDGSPIRFGLDSSPAVLTTMIRATHDDKPTYVRIRATGMPTQQSGFSGSGSGGSGFTWAPAGANVSVSRSTPGALGVGTYQETD